MRYQHTYLVLASVYAAFGSLPLDSSSKVSLQQAESETSLPFPNAIPQPITKPSGTNSTIYIASFFTPPSPRPKASRHHTSWVPSPDPYKLCADSTFTSETTPDTPYTASPSTEDCLAIQQWGRLNAGHWVVSRHELLTTSADDSNMRWAPLLVLDSCAFVVGVRREFLKNLPWGVTVSSADVVKVVWEAVGSFQIGGKVLARGNMFCLSWDRWETVIAPVDWRIVRWEGES